MVETPTHEGFSEAEKRIDALAKSLKAGDVFTISGVYDVNHVTKATLPHLKQFTIVGIHDGPLEEKSNETEETPPATHEGFSEAGKRLDALAAKPVIAVCIPTMDGKVCWETMFALWEEQQLWAALDLPWRLDPIVVAGCSLVMRARSQLVQDALDRGAIAVLFADADTAWESGAIARMMNMDVDVIAAPVMRKTSGREWNVTWADEGAAANAKGLVEVKSVGTALMLVKRRVFEIVRDRWPPTADTCYKTPEGGQLYAYFQAPGSWGEDTFFCHRWRQCGGKVWIDPAIETSHVIAPFWVKRGRLLDDMKKSNA